MPNYDTFEAQILTEGMTSEQKMQFHREMTEAWKDPDKAKRLRFWLGGIGAHHFYLGNQNRGVMYLLFCWTTVPVWICLFEGDIRKRTQQVNSQIAQNIAARIRGMQFYPPGAGFPGVPPAYPQAMTPPMSALTNSQTPSAPVAAPQFQQKSYTFVERTAQSAPQSFNMKRWALILGGGLIALFIVSAAVGAFTSKAKDGGIGERPAVASEDRNGGGTPKMNTEAPKGNTPDVQVYIAPDAESLVKAAGLSEGAIKNAVRQGLAQRQIVSIPDNAVIEGLEDWVSVRFSEEPSEGGSKLNIEFSVRNGASANNQLIRWQATSTIEGLGDPTDIPTTLAKLMDNLQAAFNSPEYKRGRMNEPGR